MSKLEKIAACVGIALVGAAILQELRRPREEREWHGRVAGVVPYEFRRPTLSRIRERVWSPEEERLFNDTVFGVGWTPNLGRVARLDRDRRAASNGARAIA